MIRLSFVVRYLPFSIYKRASDEYALRETTNTVVIWEIEAPVERDVISTGFFTDGPHRANISQYCTQSLSTPLGKCHVLCFSFKRERE